MKIVTQKADLLALLGVEKAKNHSIGFVPTMGALHAGHVSLVERSLAENQFTVVSIFVNPTQFNNPADFEKYPIKTEEDKALLEAIKCDVLFLPLKEEIYSEELQSPKVDVGVLNEMMEARFRPGHFEGVMDVVYRFFQLIEPNRAYFGLKDFQQLAIIQKMTLLSGLGTEIVPCRTVRENDGLAMSSRNLRLSPAQRFEALFIYQSLVLAQNLAKVMSPSEVKNQLVKVYGESSLKLEYVEIIDSRNFDVLTDAWAENSIICIVAYVGEIRLIDNMPV